MPLLSLRRWPPKSHHSGTEGGGKVLREGRPNLGRGTLAGRARGCGGVCGAGAVAEEAETGRASSCGRVGRVCAVLPLWRWSRKSHHSHGGGGQGGPRGGGGGVRARRPDLIEDFGRAGGGRGTSDSGVRFTVLRTMPCLKPQKHKKSSKDCGTRGPKRQKMEIIENDWKASHCNR